MAFWGSISRHCGTEARHADTSGPEAYNAEALARASVCELDFDEMKRLDSTMWGTGEDALDTKARTAPGLRVTSKNRLKNVTLVLKGAVFSCFDDDKLVDIFGDSNSSEADEVPRCHALFNLLDAKIAIPSKHPKLAKPETLRQKSVDILNTAGDVLQFAFQSQSDRVSWGIIMRAIVQSRSRDQSTTTTAEPSKSSTSPQDQTPRIVPGTRKQVNFAIETVSDGSNRQEKKTIVEAPVKSKRQLAIERCGRTARELRCGWIVGDKVEVMFKRYGWTPSIIKTIRLDPSTNTEKIEVQGIGKNARKEVSRFDSKSVRPWFE